jgi:protein angel
LLNYHLVYLIYRCTFFRDNCGLIALFQPLTRNSTSDDLFCVATTHLLFSPKRGDIKLAQTQYFLAEIDRLSMKDSTLNTYYPIIICGDFNAQPQSPLSKFLINGNIKYDAYRCIEISGQIPQSIVNNRFSLQLPSNDLLPSSFVTSDCRFPKQISTNERDQLIFQTYIHRRSSALLTHNKKFNSVYDLNDASDVTTCVNNESNLVDYIFYTKQDNDRFRLNLLSRYDLYRRNQMLNLHLPNHQFASDHFLLAARFALKLKKKKK